MTTVRLTFVNGRIEEHPAAHYPSINHQVLDIILADGKGWLHVPIAQLVCWEVTR